MKQLPDGNLEVEGNLWTPVVPNPTRHWNRGQWHLRKWHDGWELILSGQHRTTLKVERVDTPEICLEKARATVPHVEEL